jgi:hypothetical protein
MRIQEHIFQGYFGFKKKQDSAKYYNERVSKLKGLDANLDKGIENFQKILENHKKKLDAYFVFLKNLDKPSLALFKAEIKKLEGMFDIDEVANDNEEKYVLRIEEVLKELTANEDSSELNTMEKEVIDDVKSLHSLIESIGPLWSSQLAFIQKNDDEILGSKANIKIISDILKEESDILRVEESLLKKIDLKTGAILRKTSLKMHDVERTKDMNMAYREIKHIR